MLRSVVSQKLTDDSDVLTASIIALMMEAGSTSKTSVNFYETTRRNIPEDSNLQVLLYFHYKVKKLLYKYGCAFQLLLTVKAPDL
jgi:hypothetical protein